MNKIEEGDARAKTKAFQPQTGPQALVSPPEQEFIDIKMLAFVICMSERMIFNLIGDPHFPRSKIGRRLLFEKKAVMDFLVKKYGNW
jgi:predicted DNA-binding transcriptional regulator AlpA